MGWGVLIELTIDHEYYAPNAPPVTFRPSDKTDFDKQGLMLRQQGARVFVLAQEDANDVPAQVTLDLHVKTPDVITVTFNSDWKEVPVVWFPAGTDQATLPEPAPTADNFDGEISKTRAQTPGQLRLAHLVVETAPGSTRALALQFAAVSSHWAYHVIGPGNDEVIIEDVEGQVAFDTIGPVDLPNGSAAYVLRSKAALPARARPGQRFSLSKPGPFGPRTVIPVLPTPQLSFATVPTPDGAGALIQSDIYVSIF